jgi:uncharacterized protein
VNSASIIFAAPLSDTLDSRWRNRAEFLQGLEAIEAFLTQKWNRELDFA